MRRNLMLVIFVAITGMNVTAWSAEPVVLACNEFPPFKMENSETGLKGFDVEFLEEIFRRAEVPLTISYMPWKRALREAQRGTVDGVCSCSRTEERGRYLKFSAPLGRASSGLFSLAKNAYPPVTSLAEIRDKSVVVVLGYNLVENLEQAGAENIIQVSSELQGARVLVNDRTDYFYGYEAPVRFYLKQLGQTRGIVYDELTYSNYYSCFSKTADTAPDIMQRFNTHLQAIKRDGTYDRILAKYR